MGIFGQAGMPQQANMTWGQWLAGLDPLANRVVNGVPILSGARR